MFHALYRQARKRETQGGLVCKFGWQVRVRSCTEQLVAGQGSGTDVRPDSGYTENLTWRKRRPYTV
jgi:hypothetical protein